MLLINEEDRTNNYLPYQCDLRLIKPLPTKIKRHFSFACGDNIQQLFQEESHSPTRVYIVGTYHQGLGISNHPQSLVIGTNDVHPGWTVAFFLEQLLDVISTFITNFSLRGSWRAER